MIIDNEENLEYSNIGKTILLPISKGVGDGATSEARALPLFHK